MTWPRRPSAGRGIATGSDARFRQIQFGGGAVAYLTEMQRGEPGAPILVYVLAVSKPGMIPRNGIAKAMQVRENAEQRLILPMI